MGIFLFSLAFGFMTMANAIYIYKKSDKYNLYTICLWCLCIIALSLGEILNLGGTYKIIFQIIFGISWFLMIKTPCSEKLFRLNKRAVIIRKIIFVLIGISQFITLLF